MTVRTRTVERDCDLDSTAGVGEAVTPEQRIELATRKAWFGGGETRGSDFDTFNVTWQLVKF
jgi:hypothetical protein